MHFVSCMAASCPRLPRAPFRAETLEAALAGQAKRFVYEPRNVSVVSTRRTDRRSAIFDFFAEDFVAGTPGLIAYVNKHRAMPVPPEYSVEFISCDWTVADQGVP